MFKPYRLKMNGQIVNVELEEIIAGEPQSPPTKPEPVKPSPEPHKPAEPSPATPEAPGGHSHKVEVTATHLVTPHEKIPRFAVGEGVIVAKASGDWSAASSWEGGRVPSEGDRAQIPSKIAIRYDVYSESIIKAVEVDGELAFAMDRDTRLRVGDLQVLPHGHLKIGTSDVALPAKYKAEISIPESPLDKRADPDQFGRGLIVVGKITLHGAPVTGFIRLASDAEKGDGELSILSAATGWRGGDRLVLPDTRHVNPLSSRYWKYEPQYEEATFVSGTSKKIKLEKPLRFAHKGPRDTSGEPTKGFDGERLGPHVANLSRNIVIRSEEPAGIRGHFLCCCDARVEVQYAEFRDLGRTRAAPLNGTTNKIGRYAVHLHHVEGVKGGVDGGKSQWLLRGISVSGARKWGIAIHASHFGRLEGSVVYNVDGAGIATEDGSERGNVFEGNFVLRVNGGGGEFNGYGEALDDRGDQGDGFWFPGPMNIVHGNVVANALRNGFTYWPDAVPTSEHSRMIRPVSSPISPLGARKTYNVLEERIEYFQRNEVYGATTAAVNIWGVGDRSAFPKASKSYNKLVDTTVWNVIGVGIRFYYADNYDVDGWLQRGDPARFALRPEEGGPSYPAEGEAISNSGSVARETFVRRADVQNMSYGYLNRGRGFSDNMEISESFFDCLINFWIWPWGQNPRDGRRDMIVRNVRFGSLARPGANQNAVLLWNPISEAEASVPERIFFESFDGVSGLDVRVYYREQAPGAKAAHVKPPALAGGEVAPTKEKDGDLGDKALARARAMGIEGLAFATKLPERPALFANVAIATNGKPALFYAVIGDRGNECRVGLSIDGKTIESSGALGNFPIDDKPGERRVKLTCNLGIERELLVRFPIK